MFVEENEPLERTRPNTSSRAYDTSMAHTRHRDEWTTTSVPSQITIDAACGTNSNRARPLVPCSSWSSQRTGSMATLPTTHCAQHRATLQKVDHTRRFHFNRRPNMIRKTGNSTASFRAVVVNDEISRAPTIRRMGA